MNRVIVFSIVPKLSIYMRKLMPQIDIINVSAENPETLKHLDGAEILLADCKLLKKYRDLVSSAKWIQVTSAGVEDLEAAYWNNKNLIVTRHADRNYGLNMSEYVVQQIVNNGRNQWYEYECQKIAKWDCDNSYTCGRRLLISEMTFGILGLGNIGKIVAKTLKFFGGKIWGLTRTPLNIQLDYVDEVRTIEQLPELLSNCNYIINILPTTSHTDGLLNGEMLKNCTKSSVFMNIGRGNIIKEVDLVNALEKNWISGAILDVFEVEPLPKTSKLWSMPNVIITPHNACCPVGTDIAVLFANNYEKFVHGESLPNIVNFERGY